jgi:hypothetical protein
MNGLWRPVASCGKDLFDGSYSTRAMYKDYFQASVHFPIA